MTMDRSPAAAATVLSAVPRMQAATEAPQFDQVVKGYHTGQVRDWADQAIARIRELEKQVANYAGKIVSSPEGQQMIGDLLKIAADEALGMKTQAAGEAAQLIEAAKQQAETILADSRQQADQRITSATQQATSLVEGARQQAKQTVDAATAHAAAVDEGAGARLAHFTQVHEDGLARMRQMHDVTEKYLSAEQQRGPLSAEVDRALAPVQPGRPATGPQPQQTARHY